MEKASRHCPAAKEGACGMPLQPGRLRQVALRRLPGHSKTMKGKKTLSWKSFWKSLHRCQLFCKDWPCGSSPKNGQAGFDSRKCELQTFRRGRFVPSSIMAAPAKIAFSPARRFSSAGLPAISRRASVAPPVRAVLS